MLVLSILDCVPDHMCGSTGKLSAVGDGECRLSILDCVPDHMGSSTGKLSAVGDGKCQC